MHTAVSYAPLVSVQALCVMHRSHRAKILVEDRVHRRAELRQPGKHMISFGYLHMSFCFNKWLNNLLLLLLKGKQTWIWCFNVIPSVFSYSINRDVVELIDPKALKTTTTTTTMAAATTTTTSFWLVKVI